MMSTRNSTRQTKGSPPRSPVKSRKGVSPSRSPARSRKSSPVAARSPSRRSPARKSPARKPQSKFPARKSPSRVTKDTTEAPKSPTRRGPIKNDFEENPAPAVYEVRASRPRRSEYSIKDVNLKLPVISGSDRLNGIEVSYEIKDMGLKKRRQIEEPPPRRSSRLKDFSEDIRRISATPSDKKRNESDLDSSEEDFPKRKSKSASRNLATPIHSALGTRWEFGGRLGSTLLGLLVPITVFAVLLACERSCQPKDINQAHLKSIYALFDLKTVTILFAHIALQALISFIPILGTRANKGDGSGEEYCFNAFFAAIFTVVTLFGLDFTKVLLSKDILSKYIELSLLSYSFAFLLSIVLYWKSRKFDEDDLNPYGNTEYISYNFLVGRELHPKLWKLDVKIWISRICNITGLILAALLFSQGLSISSKDLANANITDIKQVISYVQTRPTLLTTSLMQLVYFMYFVLGESKITSTFSWQSEGVGYLQLVSSCLYPFYFTEISKYVAGQTDEVSIYILSGISILYCLGFLILMQSNRIKHEFRLNPSDPRLSRLKVLPTFHGKRLIQSGLWGLVRHPNYTGDILIHVALGVVVGCYGWSLAILPTVSGILLLIHRASRDGARCKRRYGAAWDRYCKNVPYILVPKVY